jgi:hypothetical protein
MHCVQHVQHVHLPAPIRPTILNNESVRQNQKNYGCWNGIYETNIESHLKNCKKEEDITRFEAVSAVSVKIQLSWVLGRVDW